MTKAVTYVEVDLPYCTRTYGDGLAGGAGACLASRGKGWGADGGTGKVFTGYITKGAGLTGAADGKEVTFVGSIRSKTDGQTDTILGGLTTVGGTTYRVRLYKDSSNRLHILLTNTSGTTICEGYSSTNSVQIADGWIHFAISVDLTSTSNRHFIINGTEDGTWATYTNANVDFTLADWSLCAGGAGGNQFDGVLGRLWMGLEYIDFSDAATLALVWDDAGEAGMPVYLGLNGDNLTGSAPILFVNAASGYANQGTGGDWGGALSGTVSEEPYVGKDHKCFNTLNTCQDRTNFNTSTVTYRFAIPTGHNPQDIDAIENVAAVSLSPGVISLGEGLGVRSGVNVTFVDHPWPDTGEGFDKYYSERTWDAFSQGSFWGKWRNRHLFVRGNALRIIRGTSDQALADMETRHYLLDSFTGPDASGRFTLIAKDTLKLADDDRAVAPAQSNGYLNAAITDSDTSATLAPTGIGDEEYAASGYLCIAGNEVVSFTRSGDSLTIVRGALGTTASAHSAQDRVQTVLRYSGADPADIIQDLLVTYAGIDSGDVPLADWQAETAAYSGNVYTGNITEPTGVNTLVAEIIEQAGLAVWWDDVDQQVRLRVLRAIPSDAKLIDSETMLADSFSVQEQPTKRVSRVWTYFAQIDPTKPIGELDNYSSVQLNLALQEETDYGSKMVRTITSRWIPAAGRTVADRLNNVVLGRFQDPPRKISFALLKYGSTTVELGEALRVQNWNVQDETGAEEEVPVQVVSLTENDGIVSVVAEEILFTQLDAIDLSTRVITIDSDTNNINLRDLHDSLFPEITAEDVANGVTLEVIITSGTTVGSTTTATPALVVGTWPTGFDLTITNNGRIQGKGGDGGDGGYKDASGIHPGQPGSNGGKALYTRHAITVYNGGKIYGGGGGGAGSDTQGLWSQWEGGPGGGGAGTTVGLGGTAQPTALDGDDGTADAGGTGGAGAGANNDGGDGGGPGANGSTSDRGGHAGGTAGSAVDGVSYVTFSHAGTRAGPEVN